MSTNEQNIATVKAIYEAFGTGNIPAILEHIADDVDWEYAYDGSGRNELPWLQRRRGRDGVGAFFKTAHEMLDFTRFQVNAIASDSAKSIIVALCSNEATVRATGKKLSENDEAHIWHFDAKGRVIRFRHCADTFQHANAAR